jgi:hypothetical protein
MMSNKIMIFRISFSYLDSVYEVYAKQVTESDMFGFILIEDFVFGEQTSLVVDPSEEKLKLEFNGVKRVYLPSHAIHRIDEVEKQGVAKIRDGKNTNKVALFPNAGTSKKDNPSC